MAEVAAAEVAAVAVEVVVAWVSAAAEAPVGANVEAVVPQAAVVPVDR